MQCDICGKKEATVHLTEIINEQITKLHLCEECAKQKGAEMEEHFGLANLLAGLVDLDQPLEAAQEKKVLRLLNVQFMKKLHTEMGSDQFRIKHILAKLEIDKTFFLEKRKDARFLKRLKQVVKTVKDKVWEQAQMDIYMQIYDKVKQQLYVYVREQVQIQVDNQTESQVWRQTYDQTLESNETN